MPRSASVRISIAAVTSFALEAVSVWVVTLNGRASLPPLGSS